MAFTDLEIAEHMKVREDSFWSRRRPPLHLRDQIREGQRFTDQGKSNDEPVVSLPDSAHPLVASAIDREVLSSRL